MFRYAAINQGFNIMTQSGINFTMLYLITQSSLNTCRTIVARSSHSLLRKEKKKPRRFMNIIGFFLAVSSFISERDFKLTLNLNLKPNCNLKPNLIELKNLATLSNCRRSKCPVTSWLSDWWQARHAINRKLTIS